MARKIHIITGTKGGIGKTMCSLSATWYALTIKRNPVAVDVNWHNPDYSKILSMGGDAAQQNRYRVTWQGSGFTVDRPTQAYVIPEGSAVSVWNFIIESAKRNHPYVVVDTGLHPLNLIQLKTPEIESVLTNLLDLRLQIDGKIEIYLWFLWTPSAIFDDKANYQLGDVAFDSDNLLNKWNKIWFQVWLKKLNEGAISPRQLPQEMGDKNHIESLINKYKRMDLEQMSANRASFVQYDDNSLISPVHVINPHAIYTRRSLFEFYNRKNSSTPIRGLQDIKLLDYQDITLPFVGMVDRLRIALAKGEKVEDRFNKLHDDFSRMGGRPKNVFAIGNHINSAVDFPTYLLESDARDGQDIIRGFELFAQDIQYYLHYIDFGTPPG
jgi:hypothetical protein